MAQKVNIVLIDDIDKGSEGAETVTFGLDGTTYEIDLNAEHAAELRDALALYIGHGRKVTAGRRGRARSSSGAATSGPSAKAVREWARSKGYNVPDRGRIPAEIREAYNAAH